jgi:hypothetical protein
MDAPDIAPTIVIAIELDHFGRFTIVHIVVEEQSHRRSGTTEDRKLHPAFGNGGTVGESVSELEIRERMPHEHKSRKVLSCVCVLAFKHTKLSTLDFVF